MRSKRMIIGVTASVAIYRALDVIRDLQRHGVEIEGVMTPNATKFIQPLMFSALLGKEVWVDAFSEKMPHIHLSRETDLILVVPATMDFINKLATGICDNLLLSVCLAAKDTQMVVVPAMNPEMMQHPTTQTSLKKLRDRGVKIIEPETGKTLCGEEGPGRLAPHEQIVSEVLEVLGKRSLEVSHWEGVPVLVTAGPTRNSIDPVRFLTNASSGAMGLALAKALQELGAEVTLALSEFATVCPDAFSGKLQTFSTHDALEERYWQFLKQYPEGVVFAAAAPSDMRVVNASDHKQSKTQLKTLQLEPLPDLLAAIGHDRSPRSTLIGFCVESEHLLEKARAKLQQKGCDYLVANEHTVLGKDQSKCYLLQSASADVLTLERSDKAHIAQQLCHHIVPKTQIK